MNENINNSTPNVTNTSKKPYFPDFEPVCIIADKVYAHCQQRECFEEIAIKLPKCTTVKLLDVTFRPGEIIENTLIVTPIKNRPNFSRVRFSIRVPFIARVKNLDTGAIISIPGELPVIEKDIVIFIPEARDEFTFDIVIETASQVLTDPIIEGDNLVFAVGVFIIIKVVGKVQLLIPEFGFCPEPPECEEFDDELVCIDFDRAPFPEFFPKQFEEINDNK